MYYLNWEIILTQVAWLEARHMWHQRQDKPIMPLRASPHLHCIHRSQGTFVAARIIMNLWIIIHSSEFRTLYAVEICILLFIIFTILIEHFKTTISVNIYSTHLSYIRNTSILLQTLRKRYGYLPRRLTLACCLLCVTIRSLLPTIRLIEVMLAELHRPIGRGFVIPWIMWY